MKKIIIILVLLGGIAFQANSQDLLYDFMIKSGYISHSDSMELHCERFEDFFPQIKIILKDSLLIRKYCLALNQTSNSKLERFETQCNDFAKYFLAQLVINLVYDNPKFYRNSGIFELKGNSKKDALWDFTCSDGKKITFYQKGIYGFSTPYFYYELIKLGSEIDLPPRRKDLDKNLSNEDSKKFRDGLRKVDSFEELEKLYLEDKNIYHKRHLQKKAANLCKRIKSAHKLKSQMFEYSTVIGLVMEYYYQSVLLTKIPSISSKESLFTIKKEYELNPKIVSAVDERLQKLNPQEE